MAFEERLALLVDREATERENKRLVAFASLRQNAVVEDIDMKAPRGLDKPLFQKLVAGEWIDRHQKDRPGPLVIATHHACRRPALRLSNPPTSDELLSAAYYSDLTALMVPAPDDGRGALRPADLWIHGHTHESFDAVIGETRVVSNAKGYGPWPPRERAWDNPDFNEKLIIEI